MAKPALVAIGAILLLGGGGLAGYGLTRTPTTAVSPQASEAMTSAIGQLDGDIKALRASMHDRATFVAGLGPVQSVVATIDVDTAKEMQTKELKFPLEPGEAIELGAGAVGAPPTTLLVLPEGGQKSAHAGTPGSFADMSKDKALLTEVVSVTPSEKADTIKAYVSVSRPLDLKPAIDRLTAAGITGEIKIGAQHMPIGTLPPNATTKDSPLPSWPDAHVIAAAPVVAAGGKPMPLIAGGGGASALGLILLILGLVSKGGAAQAISTGQTGMTGTTGMTGQTGMTNAGIATTDIGNAQTRISEPGLPISGSAGASTHNLGPGATIGGRWEIVRRLGSGGMADVYLARSKGEAGFEKIVAVKVMHPHLARNQRAVEHFLDEARLASNISHPNVIAIQDLGKIGDDYVIVMEYVDGVDLERLLASARDAKRQVPIEVGLGIVSRMLDGLTAAHRAVAKDGSPLNVIHRDVKSANVLVSKQGGVKVVDFGIAKAAQQAHQTVAGETKGTPSMMAPEQRVGEAVDVRADVYSAAAVAFEVLTGHGVNLDLAALAHLGVENWPHLPQPTSLRPQLPKELDSLLLGSMAFERDKRPADCAALEEQLAEIMKRYNLVCSDKDIARWVSTELAMLSGDTGSQATALATPA